jgi:hypothetical protein
MFAKHDVPSELERRWLWADMQELLADGNKEFFPKPESKHAYLEEEQYIRSVGGAQ